MNPLENNRNAGRVIFLTGASSGMGKATAKLLLESGAKVFDFSRSRRLADEVSHENLHSHNGDVGNEANVKTAFAACLERFGTVDVLINNAGIGLPSPDLVNAEVALYDDQFAVNVRGVFLCTREALAVMKPKKSGHILTVISMAGQRTNPTSPVYVASKFAARGLSGALADQVLKLGIKVTDINPGPTDSDYWGDRPVAREKFLKPDDVARVIRFVLSQPDYVLIREINFDSLNFLAG